MRASTRFSEGDEDPGKYWRIFAWLRMRCSGSASLRAKGRRFKRDVVNDGILTAIDSP